MLQLLSNSAKALRGMSLILRVNILKNFGWSGRSNWFKQSEWDLAEISLASGFEGHNDFSKSFNFFFGVLAALFKCPAYRLETVTGKYVLTIYHVLGIIQTRSK